MNTERQLQVEPLPGATFGAVVTGIVLTDLSSAAWADIEAAFHEHGMLIFPEQYLTADTLPIFAKRFGSLQGGGSKGADRARSITNQDKERKRTLTERDPTWLTSSYTDSLLAHRWDVQSRGAQGLHAFGRSGGFPGRTDGLCRYGCRLRCPGPADEGPDCGPERIPLESCRNHPSPF